MFSWFEKRINAFPEEKPEQPPQGLVAFCLHYSKGMWPWLIFMGVLTALVAIMEISLFSFLGDIVNWLTEDAKQNFFHNFAGQLILIASVILIFMPLAAILHSLVMHQTLLGNFPMRIRFKMHRYLLGQSMHYFQNEFAGRISTKLMQTALAVRETMMKLLDVMNYVIVYVTGTLILVATADWRLMLPFVVWLAVYIGLLAYSIPKARKASEEQSDARSLMTGRIVDSYTNIATVKLFSHSAREETYARSGFTHFLTTVHKQMRIVSKLAMGVDIANNLLLFAVGALGVYLWQQNAIMVGAVAVAIGLVLRLNSMAHWIMWEVAALFENIGVVIDGMHSIAQPRLIEDDENAKDLIVKKGDIQFKNVVFHYGKGNGVLDNLNLKIKAGQKIGIVGRSGAGKSTLVNLLLRFHDVEAGEILIDKQNIAQVTQESLRAHIGMVTQDTSLLHRSIRDNIKYGRPDASEEDMFNAVRDAEAAGFVDDLRDHNGNNGYDAYVGERGARLSGGQRQRIAISRVMLKDAPILILDEATSALDSEAEAAIQDNLARLMKGKTVLAIAHRLSTIAEMDRLIVMDKGKIVEDGSHQELLAKNGIYANLWRRQVGGHLDYDSCI